MRMTYFAVWLIVMAIGLPAFADEAPVKLVPVLKINKDLDKRTIIKPSTIPNAGNGLFASVPIREDEVIGELGGRLMTPEDPIAGRHYLASIPECAWEETKPYRYLDSKDFGGNVSRINFAPSKINGIETHFQNAGIRQLCVYPYFVFVALRDIEPGAEIWTSYGPHYEYDRFMRELAVRNFFCSLVDLECGENYFYEY
jgi:SET domain-containing protein